MRFIKILFIIIIGLPFAAQAQRGVLFGKITDNVTNEALISANVQFKNKGVNADFEGNYTIDLPEGTHEIVFSYVGYNEQTLTITITAGETTELNVAMVGNLSFQEVVKIADIAIERKTPVAFTNVATRQIAEELASQDLPMILNSTPGIYATQQGGGDGDARINIRGFNQRNIAVMLDGVPVNDMENGWVYWSNWFGLDLVTKTMQVQRGLGASRLAIPSVGGTINILTQGINNEPVARARVETGTGNFVRATASYSSGRLENGWGYSLAGSYKQSDGWTDGTFSKGYFYYFRIDKAFGNNNNQMISLTGFGAPQEHGQRPFKKAIGVYSFDYAKDVGISQGVLDSIALVNQVSDAGRKYNEHWGTLNGEEMSTRKNYYHKPQFSLRHSWTINEKLYLSNVAYLSVGRGGGTAPESSMPITADGQVDLDSVYRTNSTVSFLNPDARSTNILRASVNNHFWTGFLSNITYDIDDAFKFSGGIDFRYYRGDHFRMVYDLLGGNYYYGTGNSRINEDTTKLYEGDRYDYDNSAFIYWGGAFGLLEYNTGPFSAFINLSAAQVRYALEDYMKPMAVDLADTSFYVSYDNPVTIGDETYTVNSPEAKNQRIDWITRPSFTVKLGASYNIGESHNVFLNTGYLSRPTRYINTVNTFINPIAAFDNIQNELIFAYEVGYQYKSSIFSANLNAYWTNWFNKPLERAPTVLEDPSDPESDRIPINVNGISALHKGIELDFVFKLTDELEVQGLVSLGDWFWNSEAIAELPDGTTYEFDATGVHVGDAAQTQLGAMIRYEPIERLYFKVRGTYFDRYYADFVPESLKGRTARRDSWRAPAYLMLDYHMGYGIKINGVKTNLRLSVLNVLDAIYVTDATNNDGFIAPSYTDFDAKSAGVFFGLGRRWNASITITL